MQRGKACLVASLFFLIIGSTARAGHSEVPIQLSLAVTVQDENGAFVPQAHIYIFSKNKRQFFGTREAFGKTTFDLPAGDYLVYAAKTVQTQELIDHYSTPEALVHLDSEEPASVILSLHKADDSPLYLTESARQKLGIEEELTKYSN